LKKLRVKLNSAGKYQKLGILLAAKRILNDYVNSISQGVEPEAFSEIWLKKHVVGRKVFRDDIVRAFMVMLQDTNNG